MGRLNYKGRTIDFVNGEKTLQELVTNAGFTGYAEKELFAPKGGVWEFSSHRFGTPFSKYYPPKGPIPIWLRVAAREAEFADGMVNIRFPNLAGDYAGIDIPDEPKDFAIPLMNNKGKIIKAANFTVDPGKIYAGLNKLMIMQSPAFPPRNMAFSFRNAGSYTDNSLYSYTTQAQDGDRMPAFISDFMEKNKAFKEFQADHKALGYTQSLHPENIRDTKRFSPVPSYAGMFIGAGHAIAESYMAIKKALRNPFINLDSNKPYKIQLESLYRNYHDFANSLQFNKMPRESEFQYEDVHNYAVDQIDSFHKQVASFYNQMMSSFERDFDKQEIEKAQRQRKTDDSDFSKRLREISNQYTDVAKQYGNVSKNVKELSKQYKDVTQQYTNTYQMLKKMKTNLLVRTGSTGDTPHMSYDFFKNVFDGRKL